MRNALAYASKTQRRSVSAWVSTPFAQDYAGAACKQWREVADQARLRVPKLAPRGHCSYTTYGARSSDKYIGERNRTGWSFFANVQRKALNPAAQRISFLLGW